MDSKKPFDKNNQNLLLNFIKCDFCNSNNYEIILKSKDYIYQKIKGEYYIVRCSNCGLTYTNPRLKTQEFEKIYSNINNYDNRPIDLYKKSRFNLITRKDILTYFFNYPLSNKNKFRKIIQYPNFLKIRKKWKSTYFAPKYLKNGKILELGCSYGGYLYQLKLLGWNVKGVELNDDAVKYAKNVFKIDVIKENIEKFQSNEFFDIIYLLNVLEHSESPKKLLEKCYYLLKPHGILVISVPDFNGIEVKIFKKYAYTLQLPYHLYHFTPKTIKNYLYKLNFNKIKITHLNSDRDLIAPLAYVLKDNPKKKILNIPFKFLKNKYIRKILIRFFINMLAFIGATSRMNIVVHK